MAIVRKREWSGFTMPAAYHRIVPGSVHDLEGTPRRWTCLIGIYKDDVAAAYVKKLRTLPPHLRVELGEDAANAAERELAPVEITPQPLYTEPGPTVLYEEGKDPIKQLYQALMASAPDAISA